MNVSKVLQCQDKASLCQSSQEAAAALSGGVSDGLGGGCRNLALSCVATADPRLVSLFFREMRLDYS